MKSEGFPGKPLLTPHHSLLTKAGLLLLTVLAVGSLTAQAALVGSQGYTNAFATQPVAADWSTLSLSGGAGNIASPTEMDTAIQAITADTVTTQAGVDPNDPPAFLATAMWSSSGLYLQTRPTGNGATLLMCTLVNNLGLDASAVTLSYDYASVAPTADEIQGHRAYYSLSGAAGSWVPVAAFSSANAGRLSATVNIAWPTGGSVYVLWADDNGSGTPDTAHQIDNFSALATPATHLPVSITSQPQSRTVGELAPVSFTVGTAGHPAPTYQWFKNNAPIPGATHATYALAAARLSDHGAAFQVVAANTASNVEISLTDIRIVNSVGDENKTVRVLW